MFKLISKNKPFLPIKNIFKSLINPNYSENKLIDEIKKITKGQYILLYPYNRTAIYAVLKAFNFNNREVIVSSYNCVVVANSIICSGNIPVFVDIDENDFNILEENILSSINSNTAAIIITDMYGIPFDTKSLKSKLRKDIVIIEDSALSTPGYKYSEDNIIHSDVIIYSMDFSKIIVSPNGGGILVTNDKNIYEKLNTYTKTFLKAPTLKTYLQSILHLFSYKIIFNKFIYKYFDFIRNKSKYIFNIINAYSDERIEMSGQWDFKLNSIQIRIATEQLKLLNIIIEKRKKINEFYFNNLNKRHNIKITKYFYLPLSHFPILIKNRDNIKIRERLYEKGIEVGRTLDYSLPEHKLFKIYCKDVKFHTTEKVSKEIINLPNYPALSLKDAKFIVTIFNGLINE